MPPRDRLLPQQHPAPMNHADSWAEVAWSSPVSMVVLGSSQDFPVVTRANPSAATLFGFSCPSLMEGIPGDFFTYGTARSFAPQGWTAPEEPLEFTTRAQPEGTLPPFWLRVVASPTPEGTLLSCEDVTAREEEIQRVLAGIDRERLALERDLHDSAGQLLTGIQMRAKALALGLDGEFLGKAEEIKSLAQEAQRSIRELVGAGETPSASTVEEAIEEALVPARRYFDADIRFESEAAGAISPTPESLREIARITGEAVHNACKHARPGGRTEVSVELEETSSGLLVIIEDNGTRAPSELFDSAAGEGLGLSSMRTRARMLSGQITYSQTSAGGARLELSLPAGALQSFRRPR